MARHNPGDHPSANARTAPTPSEPNTPIAEHIPVNLPPTLPEEQQADLFEPKNNADTNHSNDHDENNVAKITTTEEKPPPQPVKEVIKAEEKRQVDDEQQPAELKTPGIN